ncbi:MAG TPA: PQQ-binding-like beta-propeller repeat protein [Armatimonadota bacterium]|nr:PQQ-binding-like beta-propeller repeat protein [Armatimonadota bacterium]
MVKNGVVSFDGKVLLELRCSRHVMTLLIFACLALAAQAGESPERKPFVLDTVLVSQGVPEAVIVAPDRPEFQALAEKIRAAAGASIPIRKDSEFASSNGEPKATPDANVILLGNQQSSGLVTQLCFRGYCMVDTTYPGKGCYIIRTIHDPWGTGVNVILLTGSDLKGISRAVDRFCAELPRGETIAIPRTFEAEFSKEVLKAVPSLSVDPSDADIAKRLEDTKAAFLNGVQGGMFNPIVYAGNSYSQSGKEGYARLFRDLLFLAEELSKEGQGSFGGPWGAAADFLFGPLIMAWDNVEESPSLSAQDRQRINSIILDYISYWEQHGYVRGIENPIIRTNHWTFEGQGWLAAGQYFSKYYDIPDGRRWLQMADWCFGEQMKSFKSQEDCSGYQWITERHMCRYATTRPDYSWFKSGKARTAGDLAIMCTDNLGYQASFGDVGGFNPSSEMAVLSYLLNVERHGRYMWAIRKGREVRPVSGLSGLAAEIPPVEPTDLLGVKCLPTDPLFHAHYKGIVPQERTFDKITFRTSFDPTRPYLLLDGINGCYHGHYDGNSILRFTDRGRIWLADCDYIKSLPKFHNAMLVFKDGQASLPPTFCENELVADLKHAGFTRTTTHDYAGADWRRNILWDKDRTFVVIDEVRVQTTDDYSFRCQWHTVGSPDLSGNLFRVTQKGPSFSIRNLDGAQLRSSDDPVIGQNWKGYKYAEPVIHTLQQVRSQKLPAGGRVFFLNILTTEGKGEVPIGAERAGESAVLLGSGELAGVRSNSDTIAPGIETDAQMYWLSRERIVLGNATYLTVGGRALLRSDSPESVEIPIPQDVVLPKPHPVSSPTSLIRPTSPTGLASVAKFSKSRLVAIAGDEDGVYAGSADGKVYALGSDLKPRWEFDAGSEVRAVWAGRLDKDQPLCIAVGTSNAMVFLLDQFGNMLWKHELPFFKVPSSAVCFTSADLSGDGNRALIVGSEAWHYYAFDSKGNQLWAFEILHAATAATAVDLDGDHCQEVICGTEYYAWNAIKPDGTQLWSYRPVGPHANCVVADKSGAYFGGADACIQALDAAGKRRWLYSTGDEITSLALADLDGDGNSEVIAGSLSFYVNALKSDGTRLWRRDLGEPVLTLVTADVNGDGTPDICAGTEDGHVFVLDSEGNTLAAWTAPGPVRKLIAVPAANSSLAVLCPNGITLLQAQ